MELANKISQKFDMLWITILKTAALLQNLRQPPPVVNPGKHIHTNRWALIKQTLTTGPSFNPSQDSIMFETTNKTNTNQRFGFTSLPWQKHFA